MPAKIRTIDVFANPWHSLSSEGTPQAVVHMPGTRNYIAARLDHVKSRDEDRALFYFTGEKTTVPFTGEIATAVLEGALIVADAKGAKMCGLSRFVDPKQQLDAERDAALARRRAELGDDATLGAVPDKPIEEPKAEPVAEATEAKPKGTKVSPNVTLKSEV